jgi:CRP-like cAMP-binding protein
MPTVTHWTRRLSRHATLDLEAQGLLARLGTANGQRFEDDELIKEGDPADRLFVVLSGLACRYKLLADGRRQILGYLFAGDMCDPRDLLLPRADAAICVFGDAEVAVLTAESMQGLARHPNLMRAIERYARVQQSIDREWIVNVGHRTAFERLGHQICEMYSRLEVVGLTQGFTFDLPLTQGDLGDTLALSTVHVNRTLMELRRLGLLTFQNHRIEIHDFPGLRKASGFDPAYLHPADTEPGTFGE